MIKLANLERFLQSESSFGHDWARSLYLLCHALGSDESLMIQGVAPDLSECYVFFYVASSKRNAALRKLRMRLRLAGISEDRLFPVTEGVEFARIRDHKRVVLKVRPCEARRVAEIVDQPAITEAVC